MCQDTHGVYFTFLWRQVVVFIFSYFVLFEFIKKEFVKICLVATLT